MQILWTARHANREDFVDPDWAATADRPHDPGLSPDGHEQAYQLAQRVATLDVDRIVSSPFLRAVQTAHAVAEVTEHSVFLEPGLGEWQNPDWFESPPDPLAPSSLASRFEHVVRDAAPCRTPSYPESKHESLARIGETARCLVERHEEEILLLVGHGITVQGVLHGLIGSDLPDSGCPLASLTQIVRRNGKWSLRLRNDTSHLENGARASRRLS